MSVNARSESRLRKEKNAKTSTAQKLSPDKPHLTHLTIKSQNPHRRDQTDKFHKSPDAGKKSPGGYSDAEFNSTKKSPAKDDVKVQLLIASLRENCTDLMLTVETLEGDLTDVQVKLQLLKSEHRELQVDCSARETALLEKIKEKDLEKEALLSSVDECKVQLTQDLEAAQERITALLKTDEEKVSIIAALKIENQKLFTLLVEERAAKNEALSTADDLQKSLSKALKSVKSLNSELSDSESRCDSLIAERRKMIEVGYQIPEADKKKKKDSRRSLGLSGKLPLGGASTNSSTARLLRGNSTPDFESTFRTAELGLSKKKSNSKSHRRLGKILKQDGLETMQGHTEVFDNDEIEDDQSVGGNSCVSHVHAEGEMHMHHEEQDKDKDYLLFCQAIDEMVRIKSPVTHPSHISELSSSLGGPPIPKGEDLETLMESLNKAESKAWDSTLITPQDGSRSQSRSRSPSNAWAATSTLSASITSSLADESSAKLRSSTEKECDDMITLSAPSGKRLDILDAQKFDSELKDHHRQSKGSTVESLSMNAIAAIMSPAACNSSSSSRGSKHLPAISTDTAKTIEGIRTLDLGSNSIDENGNLVLCDVQRLTPMRLGSKPCTVSGAVMRTFTASARMEEIMPSTDCRSQIEELGSSAELQGPENDRDSSTPAGTRKKGKHRGKKSSLKTKIEPSLGTEEKIIEKKSKKVILVGIEHDKEKEKEKEKEKDFLGKKNPKESSKMLSKIDNFEGEKVTTVNSSDYCYQSESRKESEDLWGEPQKELSDKDVISKERSLEKDISPKVPGKIRNSKKSHPGKLAGNFVISVKSVMEKIVEKRI